MFGRVYSCFYPRVAVKVANHPNIAHIIARSRRLLVRSHRSNAQTAPVAYLIAVVPVKAHAKALRLIKFIIIYLGLRMIMRRIAGPTAGLVEHLAQHKI